MEEYDVVHGDPMEEGNGVWGKEDDEAHSKDMVAVDTDFILIIMPLFLWFIT